MELTIYGRYIDSESTIFYHKYIKSTNLCNIHKFGFSICDKDNFGNTTIISFIEEIAKIKKFCPNFLTSYYQLASRQKIILLNCVGTLLLKQTVIWLESNIDYKNINPRLFETDLLQTSNDMCHHEYNVFNNMATLIKKINLLLTNCECKHILTISQKMQLDAPIYSHLNLVYDIISNTNFTDHKINIDTVIKNAFKTIHSELYEPQINNKKLSELPRHLREKINTEYLQIDGCNKYLFINKEDNISVSHVIPHVHKNDIKNNVLISVDLDNSVCIICDSILHRHKYKIEKTWNRGIYIEKHQNDIIICTYFCDILLEYVMDKLIYKVIMSNKTCVILVRNIRSKLFLLYGMNFCSDIMRNIGLRFLEAMK